MSNYNKFYKKYGQSRDMMLPPSMDGDDFSLNLKEPKAPVIVDPSEEEMQEWDRYVEKENKLKQNLKILKDLELSEPSEKGDPDMKTFAPKRAKHSSNQLLKMCDYFYKIASR